MGIDARNEQTSTNDRILIEHYDAAVTRFQTYVGDPIETIDAALEHDPDFVLGHIFRATMLLMMSERQYVPDALRSLDRAGALIDTANDREKGLWKAAKTFATGDWRHAGAIWRAVSDEHPRDALAVQAGHLTDFYVGDTVSLKTRIESVLPHWEQSTPGFSYILGMQAFGLEEYGNYLDAEVTGMQALEIDPEDGWAIHAIAHVMEMQGRFDEGKRFLQSREHDWAPENGFAFHNWWHLALFYLESGDTGKVLDLYDCAINPEMTGMSLQMCDASALLWRLHLRGVDTDSRGEALAAEWLKKTPMETGYYAFNDWHALMALVVAGHLDDASKILRNMAATAPAGDGGGAMRAVGLPIAEAVIAFSEERYVQASELLDRVRPVANRGGGSHAQRDILTLTQTEAALRSGNTRIANTLINDRFEWKPESPLSQLFRQRLSEDQRTVATG